VLTVNISDAKSRLSRLIDQAAAGNDVIIARSGKPIARLTAIDKKQKHMIGFGALEGKGWIADDFDDPLPEEIQAQFEVPFDPPID